ncbi:MAG: DUF3299 domain-containing protein [Planctomycetota bacterium]|nr:DUF3299 domain-containing protein [Planctomycetota bacterium]
MRILDQVSTTAAALTAALLAAACNGSGPAVMDGESTVRTAGEDAPASPSGAGPAEAPQGTSFMKPSEAPAAQPAGAPVGATGGPLELDPELAASLDPRMVMGLRQDPGQGAKGSIEGLVTFADLSLVGVPLDGLLDYLFRPESEEAGTFEFPERVRDQAGEDKAVIGYMLAIEMKPRSSDQVLEFMLVKDLAACCFGGSPRPDEWVNVKMKGGGSTQYHLYRPVVVRGDFEVGRVEDELGYAYGVFQMEADAVELYTPPGVEAR